MYVNLPQLTSNILNENKTMNWNYTPAAVVIVYLSPLQVEETMEQQNVTCIVINKTCFFKDNIDQILTMDYMSISTSRTNKQTQFRASIAFELKNQSRLQVVNEIIKPKNLTSN